MHRLRCTFGLSLVLVCFHVFSFAQATCTLSKTNRTITICTPANGATVGTTFHVNAGTTDTYGIEYIEVYVANKLYGIQHHNYLDATITVPGGTHQNLTVQAHDTGGVTFKQTYYINVSGTAYSISPQNPTVSEGGTQQFTATIGTTWSATCGSISSSGLFTAPLNQPSCKVTGKATDGTGRTATTNVTISTPVTITPSAATTTVNQAQQFSANESVTWSATCGSISSSGLFTAPSTSGTCTITATAASGTLYTASASDTVVTSAPGAVNYTTWKNDNARDGWQSQETLLTPANVNSNTFGKIFATSVDGRLWAQPLYMSDVSIGSAKHNIVYVGTANDTMYGIDGDSGAILWKQSLLGSGEAPPSSTTLHSSVQPIIGITGTPVIDPTTGTLYVVAQSGISGTYYHRLHALDIATGAEKFGGPIVINTGNWDSSQHLQRPGLLLANGNIYIAFSGNDDIAPYHGWVFAYSASTLTQVAVWNATLGGSEGGIWMGAAGIAADASGNLFLTTGNGDWNGTTQLGQSAVKLGATLDVLDYFTPIPHVQQSLGDKDLGSGGPLLLPTLTGAPHPHELVACSKLDLIYVMDRDNMGQIGTTTDNVVQTVNSQLGANSGTQYTDRCFSTPAYWNNNVYFIGNNDVVKQFSLNPTTGLLSTTPTYKGNFAYLFPGGQPVVSSNGNSNGIVWAIDWTTGTLRAYDATNVSNSLYVSGALGTGIKFTVPTVVSGHVYVGLGNNVTGFGLISGGSCAPPSSPGAKVCAPTQGSAYNSPVAVSASGTGASGTVNHMELWIDGNKIGDYFSNQVNTTVSLATGSHALTAVEVDSTGAYLKSAIVDFSVN